VRTRIPACALLCLMLGCASEERQWTEARSANTVEALQAFLTKHAEGRLADSARARIEELTRVVITGRVVLQDGTPFPGVKPHVAEFKEGQCVIVFAEEPRPHAESDRTGRFDLVVERAYLEGLENGFCLELQMPGQIGPVWGVVEAERDASGRHKVRSGATFRQLEEGVLLAFSAGDRPLVFRVPETESVMDLGDVYVPGEIQRS